MATVARRRREYIIPLWSDRGSKTTKIRHVFTKQKRLIRDAQLDQAFSSKVTKSQFVPEASVSGGRFSAVEKRAGKGLYPFLVRMW